MELWTEYEGRTIDGAYPLTKLLQPEGRSAFFSTSNGTGVPTVIRLIESHFDDDEILSRWRGVAALNHANLVVLKKFGQVTVDETSLVYAVMEPVQANLGEIVRQQRLTLEETKQLAASLVSALGALHENGYLHEHVEPANVLAVGEVVKLRSDCIREAPEGEDGRALKRKDVRDFAVVVLQALTQQKTLEGASRDLPLPAPFDEIVRKGMSGEWGLQEIDKALDAMTPTRVSPPVAETKKVPPVPKASAASRVGAPAAVGAAASAMASGTSPSSSPYARKSDVTEMKPPVSRVRLPVEESRETSRSGGGFGVKVAIALAALVLIGLVWHLMSGGKKESTAAPRGNTAPAPILDNGRAQPAVAESAPVTPSAPVAPKNSADAGGATRGNWRVVAFTYNREDQAQHKAQMLEQDHPDLKPEVYSPTGRAPYLVTLGGAMSREDAFALSGKAKREGLPRDIYAQNYRNR